jgi:hypothetical protein
VNYSGGSLCLDPHLGVHFDLIKTQFASTDSLELSQSAMEPPNVMTNSSGLPIRLQRFKDVCVEKRLLKGHIENLIERREKLAVHEVGRAEVELERIRAKAAAIRSQIKETRLADADDVMKREETINYTSNGSANPVTLPRSENPEGDSPSPLDTSAVKDSTRNSASFKSVDSPILSPSIEEHSVIGSAHRTSFKLDRQSEGTATIPLAEEDGQRYDDLLVSQSQRYAELCQERRALESEIEKELADEEQMALMRVESARASLEEVRGNIADIVAGLRRASEEDTVTALPRTVSSGDPHRGDTSEDGFPVAIITQPSNTAKVDASSFVSDTSTPKVHDKPSPSLRAPDSPVGSHFGQRALTSPDENQAAGSHIVSMYKTRKKLHKRGLKPTERTQGVSPEESRPLIQKSMISVAGEG